MREDGKGISVVSVAKSSLLSRDSEATLLTIWERITLRGMLNAAYVINCSDVSLI